MVRAWRSGWLRQSTGLDRWQADPDRRAARPEGWKRRGSQLSVGVIAKNGIHLYIGSRPLLWLQGVTDSEQPYNPLDRVELGKSVERALLAQPVEELVTYLAKSRRSIFPAAGLRSKFPGAGLYALYYAGSLPVYTAISPPRSGEPGVPIYVGRARPRGARQGALGLASTTSEPVLFDRLRQHANSILAVELHSTGAGEDGLHVSDFLCRHLVADDIWVPMGEALLIGHYRPVWNVAVDGFGNHGVGSGREKQARSPWDILHPGRTWAFRLAATRSDDGIRAAVVAHFEITAPPDLDTAPVLDEAVMRALAEDTDSES